MRRIKTCPPPGSPATAAAPPSAPTKALPVTVSRFKIVSSAGERRLNTASKRLSAA
jgi:hypothetical protein